MSGENLEAIYICDDFGLDSSTDFAISELITNKYVDGCSILVTHLTSKVDIGGRNGLHFNLTEGSPISDPLMIASLVNKEGRFYTLNQLFIRTLLGQVKIKDIETELDAQLSRFKKYCGEINHIDGHQHIQFLPRINQVIKLQNIRIRSGRFFMSSFSFKYLVLNFFSFLFYRDKFSRYCIIDFSSKVDLDSIKGKHKEFMLHVAHPELESPMHNNTTFDYNSRVEQYHKCKAANSQRHYKNEAPT